ncbi:trace amine-associated receptor 1-like [Scomber japonicus]|uniref:trace amine-associated receptor 1-like n=1 Tax=Scomber japonicus TaxID=13676 RepID=UPI002306DAAD|nr:trace amine-associated receptor 1-like [Scomber japonicus]
MKLESTVYRIYVDDVHLCYEIDNVSYILTSNPSTMCVLFYVFCSLLSVVTICGNLLVIISIIYFKQLHTSTNYLILSLAVVDMLVGALVFPLSMTISFSLCLYSGGLFCRLRDGFEISLTAASILHLCCISIDRYHAVCQPLTYRTKINDRVVMIMILGVWGASVITAVVFVMLGSNQHICKEKCLIDVTLAIINGTLGIIVTFYLPLIVMLFIYLKIFLVAQRQARSIQATKSGTDVRKMERKATRTLAIVMGVFTICWTPFFTYLIFHYFGYDSFSVPVTEAIMWLALSNSMLNPFIYGFFYSWFRLAFKIIISGKILQGDFANSKLH